MASAVATHRLRRELTALYQDPPPHVIAEPHEADILTWYYAIRGPVDTVYQGGVYVGKLVFPAAYPLKPPTITMMTPSGRFAIHTPLCLSMSSFHPETWSPAWSVTTILQGVISFFVSDELTTGVVEASDAERRRLAQASSAYNKEHFGRLFDGNISAAFTKADAACQAAQERRQSETASCNSTTTPAMPPQRHPHRNTKVDDAYQQSSTAKLPAHYSNQMSGMQSLSISETVDDDDDDAAAAEKRRLRNAKKKAKQKTKKQQQQQQSTAET